MKGKVHFIWLILTVLFFTVEVAHSAYYNLGTDSPPNTVGGCPFIPFDITAQAEITDGTYVNTIPGAPAGYTLNVSPDLMKRTVPISWGTWSHGYQGPVFFGGSYEDNINSSNFNAVPISKSSSTPIRQWKVADGQQEVVTFTLSSPVSGFMLYVEPNAFDSFYCTVSTNGGGGDSGPVSIVGDSGATGFAFVSDTPDITTITVVCDPDALGFAVGEFAVCAAYYTLTVTKSGTGSGTVTSDPAGISCGSDCSEAYSAGTAVTLTATPDSGSSFGGWSGDCSSCGSNTTCSITMNTNRTCGASFNAALQVTVPTMTEWGMIVFMALAGFISVYYLRRKSI